MRLEFQILLPWITPGSRVLDLACGDGALLAYLAEQRAVTGYGLEYNNDEVLACIARGIPVIQRNLEQGLSDFGNDSFDFVLMTQALQVMKRPDLMLTELLRIGQQAIVTFPNFGHWRCRGYLGLKGRMPMSKTLPHAWYNTDNIHLCTCKDFERLCRQLNIRILRRHFLNHQQRDGWWLKRLPNILAEVAVYQIGR